MIASENSGDKQRTLWVRGKEIGIEYVEGPVGVHSRNPSASSGQRFDKGRSRPLGWEAKTSLKEGIAEMYVWIEAQVQATRELEVGA
jgi:nucleoside-diphosphate-sugar epimerase